MLTVNKHVLYKALPYYAIAIAVIIFDQFTKWLVLESYAELERDVVTPFFYLTLRFNTGAAFSFLADAGGWQRWFFGILAFSVSVLLVIWIAKIASTKRLETSALALVLGGAVGNLWDRIVLGKVVDFLVFHYQTWEWPAFNIADSAICIGAGLLILDMLMGKKNTQPEVERKASE